MGGIKQVFDPEPTRFLESNLDILPNEKPTDWIKRVKRELKKRTP
jgi:hypothetical protein